MVPPPAVVVVVVVGAVVVVVAAVVVVVAPVVVVVARVVVVDERSQVRNRQIALERLAARLAEALRVERSRRPPVPTKASRERRLRAKQLRSARKVERRAPPPDA